MQPGEQIFSHFSAALIFWFFCIKAKEHKKNIFFAVAGVVTCNNTTITFFFLFLKKESNKEIQGRAKTLRPTQSAGPLPTPPFTLQHTCLFFIPLLDTA
ncbi:MAG TPA: hypothetical protein VG738_00120 [Chitinophagaceae bacterium]|nr:hypothetical protein [Chitinophagaceae bacterium]